MATGSGLYYYGADTEVHLGDRVLVLRWFRAPRPAVVVYIPGLSPRHPDLENKEVELWALMHDDGSMRVMGYDPPNKNGQPSKRFRFIERGPVCPLDPAEPLE